MRRGKPTGTAADTSDTANAPKSTTTAAATPETTTTSTIGTTTSTSEVRVRTVTAPTNVRIRPPVSTADRINYEISDELIAEVKSTHPNNRKILMLLRLLAQNSSLFDPWRSPITILAANADQEALSYLFKNFPLAATAWRCVAFGLGFGGHIKRMDEFIRRYCPLENLNDPRNFKEFRELVLQGMFAANQELQMPLLRTTAVYSSEQTRLLLRRYPETETIYLASIAAARTGNIEVLRRLPFLIYPEIRGAAAGGQLALLYYVLQYFDEGNNSHGNLIDYSTGKTLSEAELVQKLNDLSITDFMLRLNIRSISALISKLGVLSEAELIRILEISEINQLPAILEKTSMKQLMEKLEINSVAELQSRLNINVTILMKILETTSITDLQRHLKITSLAEFKAKLSELLAQIPNDERGFVAKNGICGVFRNSDWLTPELPKGYATWERYESRVEKWLLTFQIAITGAIEGGQLDLLNVLLEVYEQFQARTSLESISSALNKTPEAGLAAITLRIDVVNQFYALRAPGNAMQAFVDIKHNPEIRRLCDEDNFSLIPLFSGITHPSFRREGDGTEHPRYRRFDEWSRFIFQQTQSYTVARLYADPTIRYLMTIFPLLSAEPRSEDGPIVRHGIPLEIFLHIMSFVLGQSDIITRQVFDLVNARLLDGMMARPNPTWFSSLEAKDKQTAFKQDALSRYRRRIGFFEEVPNTSAISDISEALPPATTCRLV